MSLAARAAQALGAFVGALLLRPRTVLALALVATGALSWWGLGIPIRTDMEDLFPEGTPHVERARKAREIVGSRTELRILVGSPDREQNRAFAADLAESLAGHDDLVGDVEFRRDISFFEKNALLFLPAEDLQELDRRVTEAIQAAVRQELELDDFDDLDGLDDLDDLDDGAGASRAEAAADTRSEEPDGEPESRLPTEAELRRRYGGWDLGEYYETPDGGALAVLVYPTFKPMDTGATRRLMTIVAAEVEAVRGRHPDIRVDVAYEGDYSGVTATVDQISHDLAVSSSFAIAVITLVLGLYFRRVGAVLLVLLPLAVGLGWMMFTARAAIGYLNMITAFIAAILMGLGIDFAVHAGSRVAEERAAGQPAALAIPAAFGHLGRALGAAAVTTMATFASLTVFDFRGFSQFGFLAAIGVASCLAAVYVVMPPLLLVTRRRRAAPPAPAPPAVTAGRTYGPSPAVAWATLLVLAVLVAASIVALPRVTFEADTRKLRMKSSHEASELQRKYRTEAAGKRTSSPALVVTEDLEATRRVHRQMARLARTSRVLADVASIYSFVPEEQAAKLALVREVKRKLDNKYGALEGQTKADADTLLRYLEPEPFDTGDLPEWVRERFTDTQGHFGRYVLLYVRGVKSRADEVLRIQDVIGQIEVDGPDGPHTYYATASWFIIADAFVMVREEGPVAVALACLVVLLLLILDLRRAADVALAFVPLLVGFVVLLGALGWAGIPLNIFNIVVLPTVFGIGVDTAIHLVHRLREPGSTLWGVLRTTGAAAGISALTTVVGFLSLVFVANEGLRSIGWVAVIGITATYLASVAMIAALVALGVGGYRRRTGCLEPPRSLP